MAETDKSKLENMAPKTSPNQFQKRESQSLAKRYADMEKLYEMTHAESVQKSETINGLKIDLAEYKRSVAEYEELLRNASEALKGATTELATTKSQLENALADRDEAEEGLRNMTANYGGASREISGLRETVREQTKRYSSELAMIKAKQEYIVESRVAAIRLDLENKTEALANTREQLEDAVGREDELEQEIWFTEKEYRRRKKLDSVELRYLRRKQCIDAVGSKLLPFSCLAAGAFMIGGLYHFCRIPAVYKLIEKAFEWSPFID